jgi:Arc/MetJ-type ribon-helix-helix transcriptional regulator
MIEFGWRSFLVTINISAQSEQILEDAVNRGLFKDKQEAVSAAIYLLSEKSVEADGKLPSGNDWKERFHRHLANTPASSAIFVDDSRENIYEGRGL